jgi:hypothetical protein
MPGSQGIPQSLWEIGHRQGPTHSMVPLHQVAPELSKGSAALHPAPLEAPLSAGGQKARWEARAEHPQKGKSLPVSFLPHSSPLYPTLQHRGAGSHADSAEGPKGLFPGFQ